MAFKLTLKDVNHVRDMIGVGGGARKGEERAFAETGGNLKTWHVLDTEDHSVWKSFR